MKSYIHIDKAEFFAYHGVMPQERKVGNVFWVSVVAEVDVVKASRSDCLEDTLSYADMFQVVKQQMEIPSLLLEHVAGRILEALKFTFPSITKLDVTVSKVNPPIVGQMESVGVRLVEDYTDIGSNRRVAAYN